MDFSEKIKLLAKFKLTIKQKLKKNVDLERLSNDAAYARAALHELEDAAEDEDLLLMVLQLRELLLPAAPVASVSAPAVQAEVQVAPVAPEKKAEPEPKGTYRFGARG